MHISAKAQQSVLTHRYQTPDFFHQDHQDHQQILRKEILPLDLHQRLLGSILGSRLVLQYKFSENPLGSFCITLLTIQPTNERTPP